MFSQWTPPSVIRYCDIDTQANVATLQSAVVAKRLNKYYDCVVFLLVVSTSSSSNECSYMHWRKGGGVPRPLSVITYGITTALATCNVDIWKYSFVMKETKQLKTTAANLSMSSLWLLTPILRSKLKLITCACCSLANCHAILLRQLAWHPARCFAKKQSGIKAPILAHYPGGWWRRLWEFPIGSAQQSALHIHASLWNTKCDIRTWEITLISKTNSDTVHVCCISLWLALSKTVENVSKTILRFQ